MEIYPFLRSLFCIILNYYSSSGAAVWGGDVGGDSKDGAGTERVPAWGGEAAHWETGAEREGRGLALPLTRGGHEGGGINGYPDVDTEKAEHGRAVHCDATASGPVRGGESEGGSEGAAKVVGPGGHRLGNG